MSIPSVFSSQRSQFIPNVRIFLPLFFFSIGWWHANSQMTIQIVSTPQLTPLFCDIYVAGSLNEWAEGDSNFKLTEEDGIWEITFDGNEGEELEFKFTRGSWSSVEGSSSGGYIPNRSAVFQNGITLNLTIEGWEDIAGNHTITPNVHILNSNFLIPQLNRSRRIWIVLPTDYAISEQEYPVVYLHDGQNLFDAASSFAGEWRIDEAMISPNMTGCKQAIFVGIDNGGGLRLDELSPWHNSQYDGGGEGSQYIDFIVETLKPFIDNHFRTLSDREHTTIAGSSLGGLISMYAIAKYNSIFSKAGIFSPAFWFNPEIFNFVEAHPLLMDSKIYFVCGTNESSSMVSDMQQMRNILLNSNVSSENIAYHTIQGGQHNESFWANQFPAAHIFLSPCLTTSISAFDKSENIVTVYPNPARDSIQVLVKGGTLKRIVLYDYSGRIVKEYEALINNQLDISKLPRGKYEAKISYSASSGESHTIVKTVVLQ